MITLNLQCSPVFVGITNQAEVFFTNPCKVEITGVTYVASLSNAPVDLTFLQEGAVVTVASDGSVLWTDGAPISWGMESGFAVCILFLGTILGIRRVFGWFGGLAGIETGERA